MKAFATLKILSERTSHPRRVYLAMHKFLYSNIKLSKRVSTVNLLTRLKNAGLGTQEIERKNQDRMMVSQGMKVKIQDAEFEVRKVRGQFFEAKTQYMELVNSSSLKMNSEIDKEFKKVMKFEVEEVWRQRKEHNERKFEFLINKRKAALAKQGEESIEGVLYRDSQPHGSPNLMSAPASWQPQPHGSPNLMAAPTSWRTELPTIHPTRPKRHTECLYLLG